MQAESLLAEPQGKPKNMGVGSLSLPQQIFPTQESNQGHLHGRWILYQLSYPAFLPELSYNVFFKNICCSNICNLHLADISRVFIHNMPGTVLGPRDAYVNPTQYMLFSPQATSVSPRPHGLQDTRLPCPSPSPGVSRHPY